MIVVTIIAAVIAIGAPKLLDTKTKMQSAVRKLSTTTRSVRTNARIFNLTSRLVVNFDDQKGHTYWVESAPGNMTLLNEEQEREEIKKMEQASADDRPKSKFSVDPRPLAKPEELPKGLFFKTVEFANRNQKISSGKAYIHFFPQGLVEEAAIQLTDKKGLTWTITVHPLTGRNQIFDGAIGLKELQQQ